MRIIALITFLILTVTGASAQNLIGFTEKEIRKYMKENRREMNYNNVINDKFKYLKYSDNYDNQTLIFFLSSDSVCLSIRTICDKSLKDEKVREFNSNYRNIGQNKWIDNRDGKDFLIEIKDEKWSCIVSVKPDK